MTNLAVYVIHSQIGESLYALLSSLLDFQFITALLAQ